MGRKLYDWTRNIGPMSGPITGPDIGPAVGLTVTEKRVSLVAFVAASGGYYNSHLPQLLNSGIR